MIRSNELSAVENGATVSPGTLEAPSAVSGMRTSGKKKPGHVTIMRPPIGMEAVGLKERVIETPVLKLNLSAFDTAKVNPVIQDLIIPLSLAENAKPAGGW
jgi:hypothetical protein